MKSLSLKEIATLTQAKLMGDPEKKISGIADLKSATDDDASFVVSEDFRKAMLETRAGVLFIPPNFDHPDEGHYLINENPSNAFQILVEQFKGPSQERASGFLGVHETAVIHPTAKIADSVRIGPNAVIDRDCVIKDGTFIGAGCYIGAECSVGSNCTIHPNVTIREKTTLGERVNLQPGVIIGGCGFGYQTDAKGTHKKISQVGYVEIQDDVEIGAGTTVCRARFGKTVIGSGTKIDTLAVIGHGVKLGPNNLIVGQAGIAGSSITGRNVVLAGHVAVKEGVELTDGVIVTGKSGVSKSLLKPGAYGGVPAIPLKEHHRQNAYFRKIETLFKDVKRLKQKLEVDQ